jgi:hypothetical protein
MLLGVTLGGTGSNEIQVEGNRRMPLLRLRLSCSNDAKKLEEGVEIREAGSVDIPLRDRWNF